jgi:hypothetical protein
MARYIRFIVHQRIREESRQLGLFSAAYYLWEEGEMLKYDRLRLRELLDWFRDKLTIPPKGTIPDQAIFWYADVGPFSRRMWELVQFIKDYGFTAEQISAESIGRVVYQDAHQVAAIPPTRVHR